MAEFLDGFDVERDGLITALEHFESVWSRFRERRSFGAESADVSDSLISTELAIVRDELERANFTIGLFGLIKRGKSTLLNALIGREVSTMHVTPETAVPVYVSYSDRPGAAVHFADGSTKHVGVEDVVRYTSQKHNPMNKQGVTHVEQAVPVPFLRNGTRLIDNPGLDDAAADDVYTKRTLQELDVVDAGIVVFLSPPTVGATEMEFLEEVTSRDLTKSFLVCNMFPQHFHDRQTRSDVLNYVGGRIVEASRRAGQHGEVRVYPVCAYEAWQARLDDDVAAWKRSGADRLLRDLEGFLADVAGTAVLERAVERIEKAADMARTEVQVRTTLLEDPQRLEEVRREVDTRVQALEGEIRRGVDAALEAVGPLRAQVRSVMLEPFEEASSELDELDDVDAIEQFAERFRRRVEVASEEASRQFEAGFERIADQVRQNLQDRFESVVTDVVATSPTLRLSTKGMLVTSDQMAQMRSSVRKAKQAERTSALAGGVAGGGAVAAAAGAVLLAPIGLLGGALVGYQMSKLIMEQRRLSGARETLETRLDEIAERLLRDFDRQVQHAVDAVRSGVDRHRTAFAADLYEQFELVQSIADDPSIIETHRREAERFGQAFGACAVRARRVLRTAVYA